MKGQSSTLQNKTGGELLEAQIFLHIRIDILPNTHPQSVKKPSTKTSLPSLELNHILFSTTLPSSLHKLIRQCLSSLNTALGHLPRVIFTRGQSHTAFLRGACGTLQVLTPFSLHSLWTEPADFYQPRAILASKSHSRPLFGFFLELNKMGPPPIPRVLTGGGRGRELSVPGNCRTGTKTQALPCAGLEQPGLHSPSPREVLPGEVPPADIRPRG